MKKRTTYVAEASLDHDKELIQGFSCQAIIASNDAIRKQCEDFVLSYHYRTVMSAVRLWKNYFSIYILQINKKVMKIANACFCSMLWLLIYK